MTTYDGIVLGAGHNGLILQAYASRAGLEVIALERRDEAGGGARGGRHDPHRHDPQGSSWSSTAALSG